MNNPLDNVDLNNIRSLRHAAFYAMTKAANALQGRPGMTPSQQFTAAGGVTSNLTVALSLMNRVTFLLVSRNAAKLDGLPEPLTEDDMVAAEDMDDLLAKFLSDMKPES